MTRAFVVELAITRGEDRASVTQRGGITRVALADGAGGVGGGAAAAQAVIDSAARWEAPATTIEQVDAALFRGNGGQTTAVIVDVDGAGELHGSSVGDSIAWLVDYDQRIFELTKGQMRKPLVGDGGASCDFALRLNEGTTMLVASDGLWKYAKAADIARIVVGDDLAAAARALIALVSKPLQDDVSIVLVR